MLWFSGEIRTGDLSNNEAIVKSIPLSIPITSGLLPFTLILYFVPCIILSGIYVLITSAVSDLKESKSIGFSKEPEESDNWAVKVLSISNSEVILKWIFNVSPW